MRAYREGLHKKNGAPCVLLLLFLLLLLLLVWRGEVTASLGSDPAQANLLIS